MVAAAKAAGYQCAVPSACGMHQASFIIRGSKPLVGGRREQQHEGKHLRMRRRQHNRLGRRLRSGSRNSYGHWTDHRAQNEPEHETQGIQTNPARDAPRRARSWFGSPRRGGHDGVRRCVWVAVHSEQRTTWSRNSLTHVDGPDHLRAAGCPFNDRT
jgi:hypothetical protein